MAEFRLCRDQVPAEPFAVVRRIVEADLGVPLEEQFSEFERTPIAAASVAQVHAARLRSGESVVVKVQRPDVATLVRRDLAAMSWLAPLLVGRIPVAALANPPALVELFARDHRGGARLPARGPEHARRGARAGRHRPARHRGPPPPPVAGDPPGARHGAARRLRVGRRRGHARRGDRHRGGPARRADRLPRRRPALRGLPRRPARRQPARAVRRARGPPRLRHHRPLRRAPAPGLPPPGDGGVRQRRPGADRGDARPRRAARATWTSTP